MMEGQPRIIRDVLKAAANELDSVGVSEARASAEVLLASVLRITRTGVYKNYFDQIPEEELKKYRKLIEQRKSRKPIAYILGEKEFFSLPFRVNHSTLIPRPETECLVESVIHYFTHRQNRNTRIVDVGTGSGAIAIALKTNLPQVEITGVDIDKNALKMAKENAFLNHVPVTFLQSDLLTELTGLFDGIVANLPYIASEDLDRIMPDVSKFEPRSALDGGPDGLRLISRMIATAGFYLKKNGRLFLEFGCGQEKEVTRLLNQHGYDVESIGKDLSNIPRYLIASIQ